MIENDAYAFFSVQDFAQPVTRGGGRQFNAIFDAQYQEGLGIAGSGPALTCATEDVRDMRRDEQVTIEAGKFRVVGIEPDGTGITVLRLQRT